MRQHGRVGGPPEQDLSLGVTLVVPARGIDVAARASSCRSAGARDRRGAAWRPRVRLDSGDVDWRLELVQVPVSDVDRAKSFYVDQVGFVADHDHQVTDELRFVQLTPPGSGARSRSARASATCQPGSLEGLQLVVDDIHAARAELVGARGRRKRRPDVRLGLVRLLQRSRRESLGGAGAAASLARATASSARVRRQALAADPSGEPRR